MLGTPRFVWLHGFGSGPKSTKAAYVAARLAGRGLALETPDLNEPSFRELTVSRMLGRVDALWAEEARPLALLGSSLGGYTAALWAAQNPERVASLVILAPALDLARRWSLRMGPAALHRWREEGSFEFDHYARGRKEPLSSRFLDDAALHAAFPLPAAPTLLIQGLRDQTVAPELARELAARMRQAGRQLHSVELDEGHELTADLPGLWRLIEAHLFQPSPLPTP